MAFPTIKNSLISRSTVASGTYTVQMPTGVVQNDTLILILARPTGPSQSAGPGSGWTYLTGTGGSSSTQKRLEVWIKPRASVTEPATYNWTGSIRNWIAEVYVLDPIQSDLQLIPYNTSIRGGDNALTPSATITAPSDALIITAASGAVTTDDSHTVTSPTGFSYTESADDASGAGGSNTLISHLNTAYGTVAAGSVTGPTFVRSDGGNTSGVWPVTIFAVVAANQNIAPNIAVVNKQLVASIGQTVTMQVDPAQTADPDGTITSYQWSHYGDEPSYDSPTLLNATTASCSFVASQTGAWTFQVVAIDNNGAASQPALVAVLVSPATSEIEVKLNGIWRPASISI